MKNKYEVLYKEQENKEEAFLRLIHIIELLRKECPWDKEQTHDSLRQCMLEEAYEVADAIDKRDIKNLEEELGDVLLQVVFHGILGEENGNFDISSIINRECDKMIRRHPHIFLKENIKSVDKVIEKWENVKRKEHGNILNKQIMSSVPKALPSLIRSYKIQEKAMQVGFDWDNIKDAFLKVEEETDELLEACVADNIGSMTEELGDLLFSVVNVARLMHINPEYALGLSSEKFVRRFGFIEDNILAQGKRIEDVSLEEMDKLWNEAKLTEKN